MVTGSKENAAARVIQKFIRGRLVRKKFCFTEIPQQEKTSGKTFLVGNDPIITGLEAYAEKKEKIALIATSGLRALSLICQLGNEENTPKLIIVDNSEKVIAFWRKLRTLAEQFHGIDANNFNLTFANFLNENADLFRHLRDDHYSSPNISYENQNPLLFMRTLIERHGLNYVLSVIKHTSIITQSWADNKLFAALKNIIEYLGINKIYAYPSNIGACIGPEGAKKVAHNINLLDPVLSIVTDLCHQHSRPEHVFLMPGKQEKQNNSLKNSIFYDDALTLLVCDKKSRPVAIEKKLDALINEVKTLKSRRQVSVAKLTQVLVATHERLNNKIDADSYKKIAEMVQGHPSQWMQILGGIMIALGVVITLVSVVATLVLSPVSSLGIGAGVGAIAAGVGFFTAGARKGLSQAMNDLAEESTTSALNQKGA